MEFRQAFSETRSGEILRQHLPMSLHYRHAIFLLCRHFSVHTERDYLDVRKSFDQSFFIKTLFHDSNLETILIDTGFQSKDMLDANEFASLCQIKTKIVLRLENLFEEQFHKSNNFQEYLDLVESSLTSKSSKNIVALKTICAYRGGLNFSTATSSEAEKDYQSTKAKYKNPQEKLRIAKSPMYSYLLEYAFGLATQLELPIQIHCGYGDDDALLSESNPLLMQNILKSNLFTKNKFVFLHCYPYLDEICYLSSLYDNVYFDLSLTANLQSLLFTQIIKRVLVLAPYSKILFGTDGHSQPETHWYATNVWKKSLSLALYELSREGSVLDNDIISVAHSILKQNATILYQL
jgi:predicted TIM-barrel fold metal-dependent hydrolase